VHVGVMLTPLTRTAQAEVHSRVRARVKIARDCSVVMQVLLLRIVGAPKATIRVSARRQIGASERVLEE